MFLRMAGEYISRVSKSERNATSYWLIYLALQMKSSVTFKFRQSLRLTRRLLKTECFVKTKCFKKFNAFMTEKRVSQSNTHSLGRVVIRYSHHTPLQWAKWQESCQTEENVFY